HFPCHLHAVRGPPRAAPLDQLRHDAHVELSEALRRHLRADRAHAVADAQPHPVADGGAAPVDTSIGGFASLLPPPPCGAFFSFPNIFLSLPMAAPIWALGPRALFFCRRGSPLQR